MKINFKFFIYTLFFLTNCFLLQASVSLEVKEEKVFAQTNKKGTAGFLGCQKNIRSEVPAYIYDLQQWRPADKDFRCSINGKWESVARKSTIETDRVFFENLPSGKYKVIAYYGEADGCELIFDKIKNPKRYPLKSIIYLADESEEFTISSKEEPSSTNFKNSILQVEVFPVPASQNLTIVTQGKINIKNAFDLVFHDLTGKLIAVDKLIAISEGKNTFQIDVSQFVSGTYLMKLSQNNKIIHQQKIVIISRH